MPEVTSSGPIQQAFFAQAAGLSPEQYQKLMQAQQQEALAQALLSQGNTPLSTEGRSIGGVGYAISPLEGAAKMAQILSGGIQQKRANEALANALMPQGGGGGGATAQAPSFYDEKGNLTPMGYAQILSGNRAVAELRPPNEVRTAEWALGKDAPTVVGQQLTNQANPGAVSYQQGLGAAAAQNAPVGTMPGGGQIQPPPTPMQILQAQPAQQIPQMNASTVAPQSSGMPAPLPGESNLQYKERLDAAGAGAKKLAETKGENQGDAILNLAQINARIANAKKNVTEMMQIAPQTSTKYPLLPEEVQQDWIQRFDPNTAKANSRFEQLNNQIYVQELGPLIKQLGSRGNQFVENAVKQGSAVDINANPNSKMEVLRGLNEYLDNLQNNAANQQGILSGTMPNQAAPGSPMPSSNGWSIRKVK